ncbi:MAG: hypothetical protein MSG64_14085 [Pyrinomonadaceae bacterium MAG19_C2-C3]|nr:hypothetical protein [Pyrinomonadaceae bacterium MAG19_C2-C3]
MKRLRVVLSFILVCVVLAAAWLWWNRRITVDMAEYVSADALIFIEANDLAAIAEAMTATDVWQKTAPAIDSKITAGRIGWAGWFTRLTGIGSAETVVLARSQIAVAALGVEATNPNQDLVIKPRLAIILETHTGARRTHDGAESLAGRLAKNLYGEPRIERTATTAADDIQWTTWTATDAAERRIVLATIGSLAIIGNERAAVETCLAVRRGERPSLAGNVEMMRMRERVDAANALAFGFVSAANANTLFKIIAPIYLAQTSADVKIQSAAATVLPQLASRFLNGAAWSVRADAGAMEEIFVFRLPNTLTMRARDGIQISDATSWQTAERILPANTAQATLYSLREPAFAWRTLNAIISSQLEMIIAPLAVGLLEKSLVTYGIEAPREFLSAIGSDIWTARLDAEGERTILIATVRDRVKLEREVRRTMDGGARTIQIGDATLIVAARTDTDDERQAAGFVHDHIVLGDESDVRACLEAAARNQTLATREGFRRLTETNQAPDLVTTISDNQAVTRTVLEVLSGLDSQTKSSQNRERVFREAIAPHAYAVTRTNITEDGIERRTHSSFGQFGRLIALLAN